MKVVAIYNMKGGVGKTTTAVNLSYLAAATGRRVLVWDLDPQAAASFAFRVRPRVDGFGGKHLPSAETFVEAIKETDYANLHLLPADFAYRKLDRLLDEAGKPKRVVRTLIDTLGRDYDLVFLDCPAGFTLLTEGRRRRARPDRPDRALAAHSGPSDEVGGPFGVAGETGSVLQHGRSPQGSAPARG